MKVKKLDGIGPAIDPTKHIDYYVQDNQLGAQWPHGIVPYYLSLTDYDQLVHRRVRMAMNNLEDASCIKFKALPKPSHFAPWIHINNPDKIRECMHLGENNTNLERRLVFGYDCLNRREILHSLMHAIGFKDEVMHPQRDQYIRIQWENINPKYYPLFRVQYMDFAPIRTEYDPSSIMHFHDRAFSKNGQATIAPLLPGLEIGSTGELSSLDKLKLRLIFGHECNKRRVGDLLDSCKLVMSDGSPNSTSKNATTYLNAPDEPGDVQNENIDEQNNKSTEVNENTEVNDNNEINKNTEVNQNTEVNDNTDDDENISGNDKTVGSGNTGVNDNTNGKDNTSVNDNASGSDNYVGIGNTGMIEKSDDNDNTRSNDKADNSGKTAGSNNESNNGNNAYDSNGPNSKKVYGTQNKGDTNTDIKSDFKKETRRNVGLRKQHRRFNRFRY
ncbi:hypothetical protein evm_001416 [Chilo suppressalis]|nr:hypothetical protein evm_001416 [Chilo suppressalis]